MKEHLLNKRENIVANGEIAHYEKSSAEGVWKCLCRKGSSEKFTYHNEFLVKLWLHSPMCSFAFKHQQTTQLSFQEASCFST